MPKVTVKDPAAPMQGSVDLDELSSASSRTLPVMHQVVTAQLAARRAGTQSTKTRAEVRGGGAKPWKQKGTGRARQGSHPAPAVEGRRRGPRPEASELRPAHPQEDDPAGPALGPVRSGGRGQGHRRRRAGASTPRAPKSAVAALGALGVDGRHRGRRRRRRRRRREELPQPPEVHILEAGELNAYDILVQRLRRVHPRHAARRPCDAPAKKPKVKADKPAGAAEAASRPPHRSLPPRRRPTAPEARPTLTPPSQEATPTWPATCPTVRRTLTRPPSRSTRPSG